MVPPQRATARSSFPRFLYNEEALNSAGQASKQASKSRITLRPSFAYGCTACKLRFPSTAHCSMTLLTTGQCTVHSENQRVFNQSAAVRAYMVSHILGDLRADLAICPMANRLHMIRGLPGLPVAASNHSHTAGISQHGSVHQEQHNITSDPQYIWWRHASRECAHLMR